MADVSRSVQVSGHGLIDGENVDAKVSRDKLRTRVRSQLRTVQGRGMTVDMAAGGDWTWLRTGHGLTVAEDTRATIRPERLRLLSERFTDTEALAAKG